MSTTTRRGWLDGIKERGAQADYRERERQRLERSEREAEQRADAAEAALRRSVRRLKLGGGR